MKKANTTLHIPNEKKRELKAKAAKQGITMNDAVNIGIDLYLTK